MKLPKFDDPVVQHHNDQLVVNELEAKVAVLQGAAEDQMKRADKLQADLQASQERVENLEARNSALQEERCGYETRLQSGQEREKELKPC